MAIMSKPAGWSWVVLAGLLGGFLGAFHADAQTLNNQSLSGKYYFRHLSLGTDGVHPGSLPDPRTLTGTLIFDGKGGYSFTGQQLTGVGAPVSQSGSGSYAMDAGGFLILDSPLRAGQRVNARYAAEAVVGSSTESTDNTYDLFVAVPAPASGAAFTGTYNCMTLEFPGGATSGMRSARFALAPAGQGSLQTLSVYGHAATLSQGQPLTQQVSGATYTMAGDGSGTLTAGVASSAQLFSGGRTLYLSADGNIVIGGSTGAGGHDILIGVKSLAGASNGSWNATYFGAGLRIDATATLGYAGALAARGQGKVTWSKRYKALGAGSFDYTGVNGYALNADGTGTVDFSQVALGAGGSAFAGATVSASDPLAFEIYFGVQVPALTGAGVFLNPLGVINAASFAPPGNPISPGQFITLFGTGLAKSNQTAAAPYPATLNGVSVLIGNRPAPIYFVSPGQLNVLVPFATTGPTATHRGAEQRRQFECRHRAGGGDLAGGLRVGSIGQRQRRDSARRLFAGECGQPRRPRRDRAGVPHRARHGDPQARRWHRGHDGCPLPRRHGRHGVRRRAAGRRGLQRAGAGLSRAGPGTSRFQRRASGNLPLAIQNRAPTTIRWTSR